jgi:outer membrane lipoprotein-sorting protein
MSELDEQESEFSRLLRDVPFNDAARNEHRDALRERALVMFDSATVSDKRPGWKRIWNQGREIMRRPIPRMIVVAAACLVVAGVWLFVPGRQTSAQAFNKLAETLMTAKTARFEMHVKIEKVDLNVGGKEMNPFGTVGDQKFEAYYRAPGRFRQELPALGIVNITDLSADKMVMVTLMPAAKRMMVVNLKGKLQNDKFVSQFDRLRELLSKSEEGKEGQYERLGEKEIDGHRAVGFQYDSHSAKVTLWGDPVTALPVRIESVWSGIPRTEVTMSHFEVNVDLKDSLFDVTPPAGYKVQSLDVDVAKPSEEGLIKALRTASEVGGGEFPDSMDMMGMMKIIMKAGLKSGRKGGKPPSDEAVQQLMQKSATMGVGFQFALDLPDSADAHYAGKGIKQGTANRPIFWYKPDGASKYRVIFADLSAKDQEQAPQVPGAQRIGTAGKTAKPAEK